jgi:pimeloyl-ACP methyl ester carboxylesterase
MTFRTPVWLIMILALLLAACNPTPTPAPATVATATPAPAPTTAATAAFTQATTPTTAAPAASTTTDVPRFEKTDCWFKEPLGHEVECGWLIVPEDHAKPEGNTIKLAVARFKSDAAQPEPDPIVYLEGGPGGSALKNYPPQFDAYFGPLVKKRDMILFDQRGTGYSQPSLTCPELKQVALETLNQDLSQEQSQALSVKAATNCHDRLVKEGANLAVYNTAQNAADIAALRQALGYDQVNLYGTSYGTRLALTALRDHAAGLRSVIIDSVVPLQVDLFAQVPANGVQALESVFKACDSDAECHQNYPDLQQVLLDTKAKLDKTPVKFDITLKSGEKKEVLLNGDGLIGALFQGLYLTPLIPIFPRMIYDARDGQYDLIGGIIAAQLSQYDDISHGMYYSVHCQEEAPFTDDQLLEANIKQHPEFEVLADKSTLQLCPTWNVPAAAAVENEAVSSEIPTLVLSGEFDPVTPPAYGQEAAKTLSESFTFVVPRAGHGSSVTEDCPRNMVLAFLDNPTQQPNSACLNDMAQGTFEKPLSAANFKLDPLTLEVNTGLGSLKIDTVMPADWKELAAGTYSPNGKMTDQTAIAIQAAPIKADTLLSLLESQLKSSGFNVEFKPIDTRTANGIDWTLYSGEALISAVDLAVGTQGSMTYLILMQMPLSDRAVLREAVLWPIIDALKPAK